MNKIFAIVFALLLFVCNTCAAYTEKGNVRVTALNVGQGDAFLVETYQQNILIDTGDDKEKLIAELNKAGISRLEKVILTHPHADHIGAIRVLLKNFVVDEILDNGVLSASPHFKFYRKAEVTCSNLEAGDLVDFGNHAYFKVLHPDTFLINNVNLGLQKSAPNDESIVGLLTFGDFSMLFTGDISKAVEEQLLGKNIKATVLKAPHHGSRTSSSENFIANVQPTFVVISAGIDNRFGHPHKKPLETYRVNGVLPKNIFCTAFNGTIVITSDGANVSVAPEVQSHWVEKYSGEVITVTPLD